MEKTTILFKTQYLYRENNTQTQTVLWHTLEAKEKESTCKELMEIEHTRITQLEYLQRSNNDYTLTVKTHPWRCFDIQDEWVSAKKIKFFALSYHIKERNVLHSPIQEFVCKLLFGDTPFYFCD